MASGTYLTITSLSELRALRDYLLDPSVEIIFYDTETIGGLDWTQSELLCISFSAGVGEGYVVPVLFQDANGEMDFYPSWNTEKRLNKMVDILREIFGSAKPKCGHNQLYDLRMLERDNANVWVDALTAWGIKINGPLLDTELEHHAIAESLPHNMTMTLALFTDMAFYEDEIKKYKKHMELAPNQMVWEYSARDADGLPRLRDAFRPIIQKEKTDYVLDNITLPMLRVCREIEDNGFPINVDYFNRLCQFYRQEVTRAEKQLWAAVPHRQPGWKYTYAPTLRTVLFQELGLPVSGRKTPKSRECDDCADGVCFEHDQTGKDALEDVYALKPHPVIKAVIELKNLTKRLSTNLDGGRGGMARFIRVDARIHPSMKISRAETGRLASENPNSQNIPNYVHIHQHGDVCAELKCVGRGCTVHTTDPKHQHCKGFYNYTFGINTCNAFHDLVDAPPGKVILNVDWSALELWVLAYRIHADIGDRTLLDMLLSGADPHTWMARKMYPTIDQPMTDKEWKDAHPDLRRRAKACNFGIGYGLSEFSYAQREGVTLEVAEEIFALFKSVVPIDAWHRHIVKHIEKYGWIPNEFGRRRHLQYLRIIKAMGEQRDYEGGLREGINFVVQSSGSDLHSVASFRAYISDKLIARGCRIILSVHDSLTFEADAPNMQYVQDTAWIVKTIFQETAQNLKHPDGTPLNWDIPCEVEWGQTWGTHTHKLNGRGELEVA